MSRVWKIALVAVSALVMVGVAMAWFVNDSTDAPPGAQQEPPAAVMVTLTLSATGDTSTRVTYTCGDEAGGVTSCGPEQVRGGVWSAKVTVPAGTTVRVQTAGGVIRSLCSIADETDRVKLNPDEQTGDCEAVAK